MTEAKSPGTPRKRATGKRDTGRVELTLIDGSDNPQETPTAKPKAPPVAQRLVEMAEKEYEFGCTTEGVPFAVPRKGGRIARPVRGGSPSLIGELCSMLRKNYGILASKNAREDALAQLVGDAEQLERVELSRRVGKTGPYELVLDLGDSTGRVVVINGKGWQVVESSPVQFIRSQQTRPLPAPVSGGSIDDLFAFVNIAPESRDLYTACVLSYFFPTFPHPILDLQGSAGTGKTTTARNTARLVDPSVAPIAQMPTQEKDLSVVGASSWVQVFDNLSHVAPWQSDALCGFVTGTARVSRSLYTDSGLAFLQIRMCVILTSISYGTPAPDLASRLLPIRLVPLSPEARRKDEQVELAFTAAHPRILGALLDLLVKVLAHMPAVDAHIEKHGAGDARLADFASILAALDRTDNGTRLARYTQAMDDQSIDIANDDEVADVVQRFAHTLANGYWHGTTSDLLALLNDKRAGFASKYWPENAQGLSTKLGKIEGVLAKVGIRIGRKSIGSKRERRNGWEITVLPEDEPTAERPAESRADAVAGPCDQCLRPGEFCGRGQVADEPAPCVCCGQPTSIRSACGAARTAHCQGPDSGPGGEPRDTPPPSPVTPRTADPEPTTQATPDRPAGAKPATRKAKTGRAATQQAATDAAIAELDQGQAPKLLAALERGPFAPRRRDPETGGMRGPFWRPELPGMLGAAHVVTGYQWTRPYEGPASVLDRSGAWVSSASSALVAHGALDHTGACEFAGRPGYYLIQAHPWNESDALPNPLGYTTTDQVWVPAPTVQLLIELTEQGRWSDVTIADSYTGDGARLTDWTTHVNALRAHAIRTYGRDGEQYSMVKIAFGQAMSLMLGQDEPGHGRKWKTGAQRPDWTHTLQAQASATLFRWADDARQVCGPDLAPIAVRNVDELVVPSGALEILTTTNRPGGRKPMVIDPDGIALGSFKVKDIEQWRAEQ